MDSSNETESVPEVEQPLPDSKADFSAMEGDIGKKETVSDKGHILYPLNKNSQCIEIKGEVKEDPGLETSTEETFDNVKSSVPSKFEVDVNQIESVTLEDQAAEIQSLGLTVFDQSTLERGIWDQVEKETRRREAQEELASVSSRLKIAEEQLKRVDALRGVKRSILQSALEEPSKKKIDTGVNKHKEVNQQKVKELRSKQAELQAQLSSGNKIPKKVDSNQESERDRKIRMGEMTPFGTLLSAPSTDLNSFEKYLKSQQELHRKMVSSGIGRKPDKHTASKKNSKKVAEELKNVQSESLKSNSKSILKKRILFPKKHGGKDKLGSDISTFETDQKRSPGKSAAETETAVVDLENSGSEYVPSDMDDDEDFHPESVEKKSSSSTNKSSKQKHSPSNSKKDPNLSDRWAGGSLKRRKRTARTLPEGDQDEWGSDDSDWICTDDEDSGSDHNSPQKSKRSVKRATDDGNDEDFYRRIKQWEKQNEGLREQMEEDVHEFENGYKVPKIIWDKLYTYQQVGVRWMWELNQQRCGGILGDEMGLGKTIQIISYLAGLSISKLKCRTTGYRGLGPCLIVCPTTVMHQWVREFQTWFPPLRVAILHESGSFVGRRSQLVRDMLHAKGVIITSYTAVVRLKDHLLHQRFHYVILDEGHKIRNPDAQITLAIKQLRTPHRLILSGSPLQNNLRELWSLMDFVFPGKLGTLPVFMSEFAVPISQGGYSNASEVMVATAFKCATVLRDTIGPYLLRRMKADVSDHIKLPAKNEQVLFCRLTDEQRDLYKGYLQCGEVGRILEGRCQIFVGLINLRKICNHPHLYSGGPKLFAQEREEDIPEKERFGYWEKAGKMVVIEALLKMWRKQEHRVLIFTQGRQMLLLLEKFVSDKGYRYLKLDGGTSIAARQPLINKFNEDKSYFLMLLTTKVGGLGVNLTGANRVVIYDPDWNPATDTQARERAWRIGQQSTVTVYRLITAGTIEEKMYHRQIFKQFLCNKVLKDPRQRRFFKSNDLLELFTLKETDGDNTETAAIFAGTNSQVHVKPKSGSQKYSKDRKHSYHSQKGAHSKSLAHDSSNLKKSQELGPPTKISFSKDKLEHMKRLAHELSLKLSNKTTSIPKGVQETNSTVESTVIVSSSNSIPRPDELKVDDIGTESPEVVNNESDVSDHSPKKQECLITEDGVNGNISKNECDALTRSFIVPEITGEDSDSDLDNMKLLAQELSKELSEKVQAAASLNNVNLSEYSAPQAHSSISNLKDIKVDEILSESSCGGANSTSFETFESDDKKKYSIQDDKISDSSSSCFADFKSSKKDGKPSVNDVVDSSQKIRRRKANEKESIVLGEVSSHSKHKKRKKDKKHRRRDALFEGERVRGLVKASSLDDKTREETDGEASHSAKQDDYVLRKLFAKTGIKTAMQHDKVMESGHADYALVEGEARRVAQEAVKAMKASRQHCWTAMSGQPTWTGSSGRLRVSQEAENRPQPKKPKFGKKKHSVKSSSAVKKNESDGTEGSGSLLARIRERNLLLLEEDEENASSAPAPSVTDSNQELLDDIRTFISFGASVEGRATTDEIISKFRDRLPPQTSALFKQMLMQICEFHRLPSGQGIWKLIADFQW